MTSNYYAHLRHAIYYEQTLRNANEQYLVGGEDSLKGLKFFDREWRNVLIGASWAIKHVRAEIPIAHLVSAYPDAGKDILALRLHPKERIDWLNGAVEAAIILEDERSVSAHLGNLGTAYFSLGDLYKAKEIFIEDLSIASRLEDHRGIADALGNLGIVYYARGDIREAIKHHKEALAINRQYNYTRGS